MAARNPSSFTTWWDEEALQQGKNVVETVPDLIVTGQQEIFDSAEMVVSDFFRTIRTTEINASSWTAAMEIARYNLTAIHMCGEDLAAGVHKLTCLARVWCDVAGAGAFRFQSLENGDSVTATFSNTSPAWVEASGTLSVDADGTQEDIQVDLKLTSGYTYAYCNAICCWMEHK